jgi:catechol 2,3-dioxygenase-like lactoylglutathione lyase family enzyme
MKRIHINVAVGDLGESVRFYSHLFGSEPSVLKPDYAKWMLEDPRVNFAITSHGQPGLSHLGIQAESRDELAEVRQRLMAAERPLANQGEVTCCYALSEKSWVNDPQGISWEAFFTLGESTVYAGDSPNEGEAPRAACCASTSAEAHASEPAASEAPAGQCGPRCCG